MRCDGNCIHCQRPYCDDDTHRHEPTGLDAKDPHYKRDCQTSVSQSQGTNITGYI